MQNLLDVHETNKARSVTTTTSVCKAAVLANVAGRGGLQTNNVRRNQSGLFIRNDDVIFLMKMITSHDVDIK